MPAIPAVGSIVQARKRNWIVLSSDTPNVIRLRPLLGDENETSGLYIPLLEAGLESIQPSTFPLPTADDTGDVLGTKLLWQAARLTLRDGAAPFRSLGRISVRPRAYQFVPLLMALKHDPVRVLIADDVGVGKTIEALLIARELYDRGEIDRLCVLCPPYLCDQWQKELAEKFNFQAEVIRSGNISRLERNLPPGEHSIFKYYQHIIVSIDYAKTDHHRSEFLTHCPNFVIVDEAHGTSQPGTTSRAQQQRHNLLRELAEDSTRHLVLLTATPHSGIEGPFVFLLSLLNPSFSNLSFSQLREDERTAVARHFIQRRRADIIKWLDEETFFPERESMEETYDLSSLYRELFEGVYSFSQDLVRTGETLTGWKRRIRYWAALSLLRCVMSSPAAALAALQKQDRKYHEEEEQEEKDYSPFVYDPVDEETMDTEPSNLVEQKEVDLSETSRRKLRQFAKLAENIINQGHDTKVARCVNLVQSLLQEGYFPIVWCRYIATAYYVAEALRQQLSSLFPGLAVEAVTGNLPEEDRRQKVAELGDSKPRILVATDCLSEGINLQEHFTAIIHYDLPWNPNRLEQREGRVDRFGQQAKKVKAVLFYGSDNPVDGAVLDVLLRKAKEIRKSLGVAIPVPVDSESIMESVLKALFTRGKKIEDGYYQLSLFEEKVVQDFHHLWDEAAGREKESRTRFAQKAIKPEEVAAELKASDDILGDPDAVKNFVINACQRLGIALETSSAGTYSLHLPQGINLPYIVQQTIPTYPWQITFISPSPEGTTWVGRNNPFVATLAQWLLESALMPGENSSSATRCGVLRTSHVLRRTVLLLLRLRYLLEQPQQLPLLTEEVLILGLQGHDPKQPVFLSLDDAKKLFQEAEPEAPISHQERREVLAEILDWWNDLLPNLTEPIQERAGRVLEAHRRVRAASRLIRRGLNVKPQLPPDLLGVMALLPVPKGVKR